MAGSQCCENPPDLSSSSGTGSVLESFGGLKAYTAGSSDSKAAVVLISDVFGYEAPNLRKLADKTAAAGFFVVVPDFLYGDPYVPEKLPISTWIGSHGPDKGFEDAKPVIAALKSKGVSAVGAAGFCWGAKVVAELAKSDEIKAAVMLHPSFVTVEDTKAIKVPLAVLGAEADRISPPELLKQFEEILSSKSEQQCLKLHNCATRRFPWEFRGVGIEVVPSYVKIFPGVAHGWTVRYDLDDAAAVEKAGEAHKEMIDWFIKHLK